MELRNIESYMKKGFITKIIETELPRYINFFGNTYKENLELAQFIIEKFPRWSIIAGYYAMHDMTKLFLAEHFSIKIELRVHKTTIEIMKLISNDKELFKLLKAGYETFIRMANELAEAKEERIRAQYYTGSEFMKEKYKEKASSFIKDIVLPYISKIKSLQTETSKEEKEK